VVEVVDWRAEFGTGKGGKKLLRIGIKVVVATAVGSVMCDYTITFGRYGRGNAVRGFAYVSADAPGGREADAERLTAVVEALTSIKPGIHRMKDGTIIIKCGRGHLEGFGRYAEFADAIRRWLEETSRRVPPTDRELEGDVGVE
jgi:hypothetical protein